MSSDPMEPEEAPALERLFELHIDHVHAFVRLSMGRWLRAREEVEDLVQSACVELLKEVGKSGVPDARTFRWKLCRAVRQKVLMKARYHGAKRRTPGREAAEGGHPMERLSACYASVVTPSRTLAAREQIERLEDAMAELSEVDRTIVLNARLLEIPHAVTAREVGLTEANVRSRLHRALADLARRL